MPPQHTCEWNHCRQSFATKPDLARHLSRLHKGRRPDPIDLHLDANEAFRHRVFWDGVAQRRGQAQRKRRRGNEADADDESSEGDEDDDRQPRRFRVETYPEAGWACDADGNRLDQQFPPPVPQELLEDSEAPYHPFDDKRAWNWANRSVVRRMTRSEMNELIADHEELEESPAPFKNMDHLRATIGQIEFGMEWATWKKKSFTVAAPDPETLEAFPFWGQEVTVYMRDTDALVSELLRRPSFVGRQRYAPQRISLPDGEFITEPHTGSGMWEFQSKVPRGTLIKRINLASDATVCSIGTGQVYVHPVYISISTNDPALIRNGEAQLLAGFLPVLKNKNTSSAIAEMFRRWARTVRHECMRCSQFPDLLSEGPGEPRTTAKSSALRAEGHAEARAMGLHPEETFYVSLNIDGHGCIRADSLHQLEGGVFKQINLDRLTLPYLKNACGGGGKLYQDVLDKIVKRLSCIPSYTNIRRFKDSITFGQWTHKSSRNLMAIISSALYNLSWIYDKPPLEIEDVTIDDGVPQSFALIAIIYMYANSLESTATDRKNLDYAVNLYYTLIKEVFAEEREGKGFNWMKAHSLWHYTQWTQTDGVPSHSNTSCYEAAHKQIKEFWRASNKCESLKQIMWANIRHDVMASFRIRLERSGTLPVEKQFEEPVYLPARTVLSARGDRLRKSSLADLGRERNLAQLETLTNRFLSEYIGIPTTYKGLVATHVVASAHFPIYERPAVCTFDTCRTMKQIIYAKDKYYYRAGTTDPGVYGPRFDTVLVRNEEWVEEGAVGWRGLDVYRVRLFFSMRYEGRRLDLCLADQWDKSMGIGTTLRAVHQPVVHRNRQRRQRVFLVEDILRTVLLQPLFAEHEIPDGTDFMTCLDMWGGGFVAGMFTDQHVFRRVWRPQAAFWM